MPKHAASKPSGAPSDPDRIPDAGGPAADDRDERIGLTEAFAPVGADPVAAAPEAPADDRDNAIGLTQAFAPVGGAPSGPAHAGGFSY